MKKKKPKIELRYYYMPAGSPILPLLGERWVQNYGTGVENLHFHDFPVHGINVLLFDASFNNFGEVDFGFKDFYLPD